MSHVQMANANFLSSFFRPTENREGLLDCRKVRLKAGDHNR